MFAAEVRHGRRIQWYDGEPYVVIASQVRECAHDPDRNKAKKARYADSRERMVCRNF